MLKKFVLAMALLGCAMKYTLAEQITLPAENLNFQIAGIVVLMPESLAALTAARRNRLQTSINLALGSALASIGLTIPAVALVCLIYDIDVMLGLDAKSMLLLGLSTFTVMLSLHYGKSNMLYGIVLLVNLAAYVFTVIVP